MFSNIYTHIQIKRLALDFKILKCFNYLDYLKQLIKETF